MAAVDKAEKAAREARAARVMEIGEMIIAGIKATATAELAAAPGTHVKVQVKDEIAALFLCSMVAAWMRDRSKYDATVPTTEDDPIIHRAPRQQHIWFEVQTALHRIDVVFFWV
ncbi:MAG: hypothetical protein ACTSX8_02810 [Alphaproteobacteria bacterium]